MLLIPIILFAGTMILVSGEDPALVQRTYATMPARALSPGTIAHTCCPPSCRPTMPGTLWPIASFSSRLPAWSR